MRVILLAVLLASLLMNSYAEDTGMLIQQLGHEDAEKRTAAQNALLKMGQPINDAIETALKTEKDPEIKGRLEQIHAALNVPLVLTIEPVGEAQVGKELKLKLTLKNVSKSEQTVVRCLDGSTRAKRYPYYTRTVVPSGPQVGLMGCGNCNGLNPNDLVVLKPGESCDTMAEVFGAHLAAWTPPNAGKFTLNYTIDFRAPDLIKWNGAVERLTPQGTLADALARVPKIKLEGKLEIEVKP